jgi:hypothetical protein
VLVFAAKGIDTFFVDDVWCAFAAIHYAMLISAHRSMGDFSYAAPEKETG